MAIVNRDRLQAQLPLSLQDLEQVRRDFARTDNRYRLPPQSHPQQDSFYKVTRQRHQKKELQKPRDYQYADGGASRSGGEDE